MGLANSERADNLVFMRYAALILIVAGALGQMPRAAAAQTCRGIPSPAGSVSLDVGFSSGSGAKSYGGGVSANLRGPLAVGVTLERIDLDDQDPNGNAIGGDVAYKIERGSWTFCPTLQISYARIEGLSTGLYPGPYTTLSTTTMALLVAAGHTLPASTELRATVTGAAGLVRFHSYAKGGQPGGSYNTETSTDAAVAVVAHLVFGTPRVHFGGGFTFTTLEDTDPVFSLGVGFVF